MDCNAFNRLKPNEQLQTVAKHGILLYGYRRYNLNCKLYGLQNLYIEVITNYQSKEIVTIAAYKEVDSLDHILAQIDISWLFK